MLKTKTVKTSKDMCRESLSYLDTSDFTSRGDLKRKF